MFLKKILCMNWYFLFRFPQNLHSIVRKLMMQYFLTEGFEILLFHAIGKFSSTGENLLPLPPVETSSFPPVGISSCSKSFPPVGIRIYSFFHRWEFTHFSTCGNLFNLLIFPPVGIYSIYSFSHQWEFTHFSHWWEFSHFPTDVPESTHFPTGGNLHIFPPVGIYSFSQLWEFTHFPSGTRGNLLIFPPVGIYTMLFGFENGK